MNAGNHAQAMWSTAQGFRRTFLWVLVSGLLLAGVAHADALTNLRTVLAGLESHVPVQGVLEVHSTAVKGKTAAGKNHSAHLQLEIQAGGGLDIHLAAALLQQVNAEKAARDADPDQHAPTADLLNQVGPLQVEDMVSAASMLLRILNAAGTPVVKPAELAGARVRELSVKLPLSKKDRSGMKDYRAKMRLWLDPQDVPLAYEQSLHAKFCKFFFCITVDQHDHGSLQVIRGRLVTVSLSEEHRQAGLGQDSDTRTVFTLQLSQKSPPRAPKPGAVNQ